MAAPVSPPAPVPAQIVVSAPAAAPIAPAEPPQPASPPIAAGDLDAAAVRRVWSDLLAAVRSTSRSTEAMLTNAMVSEVDGNVVTVTHTSAPLARRLAEPRNTEAISNALSAVLGGTWQVRCTHGTPGATPQATTPAKTPRPAPTRPSQAQAQPPRQPEPAQRPAPRPPADDVPPPPEPPEPDDPLPPEPDDEEAMLAEAARPADPSTMPAAQDPESMILKMLADELGARPLKKA